MAKLLRRCGHPVIVASFCADGLARAAAQPFDFASAIWDCWMVPGRD